MKKLVLAYSGGLDTSYCLKKLSNEGFDVHAISINTGGFDEKEILIQKQKAMEMGAKKFKSIDATDKFYKKIIKFLIFGNILKNNTYPLSVSSERIIQAVEIVNYAKKINANYIAHGSTGAGNDQVRFDMIFQVIAPDIKIITPIRDNKVSREDEIKFLKSSGINLSWEKAKYSINKGLWGTSVGGSETLTSDKPLPDKAYPNKLINKTSEKIVLTFSKGELIKLNGEKNSPINIIKSIQKIAEKFAIGRDIHVGDTIIGIKGRVGFEAAAPLIIIKAHHTLEKHTLTKWQLYWKEQLANWYGNLLHEGQFLDPVMRNIETFLADTQKYVTGTVKVKLSQNHFQVLGIESKHDLMNSTAAQYGEMNTLWDGNDVRGFSKIAAVPNIIFNKVNGLFEN